MPFWPILVHLKMRCFNDESWMFQFTCLYDFSFTDPALWPGFSTEFAQPTPLHFAVSADFSAGGECLAEFGAHLTRHWSASNQTLFLFKILTSNERGLAIFSLAFAFVFQNWSVFSWLVDQGLETVRPRDQKID